MPKNNNIDATTPVVEASRSLADFVNNKAQVEIMTSNQVNELGEVLSSTKLMYDNSINTLVQYPSGAGNEVKTLNPLTYGFTEPKKYGDYTRIEEGDNIFRILSGGIFGVEYWSEEIDANTKQIKKKPNRHLVSEATSLPTLDWSYFYAFYVWSYKANKVQMMVTTKRGILTGLRTIIDNQKWGNPIDFDICISKRLKDPSDVKSAEYRVTPEPKTILDGEILEKWQNSKLTLESLNLLYTNLCPFEELRKELIKVNI